MITVGKPRFLRRFQSGCSVVAAGLLLCGCQGQSPAKAWLDPLGLTSNKQDRREQPEFRQRVAKDPFPAASQVGLATPTKAESQ
jgi:hypothetical protein